MGERWISDRFIRVATPVSSRLPVAAIDGELSSEHRRDRRSSNGIEVVSGCELLVAFGAFAIGFSSAADCRGVLTRSFL